MARTTQSFPDIQFKGRLRPSQADVVKIARRQLRDGQRRLHIVAPPGAGKTVLGLYLWAECIKKPALVLSPNSAIQAQWTSRIDLFELNGLSEEESVSTEVERPALLTSLTYQSVTLPRRGGADIDLEAIEIWREKLIASQQAKDPFEADVWINDLQRHNPDYYNSRLSIYRKIVRDQIAIDGDALRTLHESSLETLHRFSGHGVGLIVLDECHHLLGHWGRVLADARELFDKPVILGLTATPPDRTGKKEMDIERYDSFFGPIDYEVPVPAVVKDGFLAPYQDLAYFVRPTSDELKFIANADEHLHKIVEEVCIIEDSNAPATSPEPDANLNEPLQNCKNLLDWLQSVLTERRLPAGVMKDWKSFARRDAVFADAARMFLLSRGIKLPANVPPPELDLSPSEMPEMEVLVPVLDRYVRHHLRRSSNPSDHDLGEHVTRRLRTLGVQITETGCQACASPVGRVMAYSRSKANALVPILEAECKTLGNIIRAVVVCDFEKTSAVSSEIRHLLDKETGGAVAAFKALLRDLDTDLLNPVLVTGSSVLVDDDLADRFEAEAEQWLDDNGFHVELTFGEEDGFHTINGKGSDWCPRVYVSMITELFQRGVTRCLVGTRGLLGEGWDANKINVLVDLTTVTTSMTVNQLRGRSIRLDPNQPDKLANNWDIVCIAPEFTKGLDDYRRFIAKHKHLYGITDDGAVEKGVGHVHAALTEIRPEGIEGSTEVLNADMLARVDQRPRFRAFWQIGRPYHDEPILALEARPLGDRKGGFPPFGRSRSPWSNGSLAEAIGLAVLASLVETEQLKRKRRIHVGERAGGYVRVFLKKANEEDNRLFNTALHEALGPLHRPRYVVPREVDIVEQTWISKILPRIVGQYFDRRNRQRVMLHAVPTMLAKNRELVAVYEKHWNRFVSPGKAVFAHRGEGERLLEEARQRGEVPSSEIHEKEIFL